VRDLIDHGVASGPIVLAAGEAITTTAGHGEFIGTIADNRSELVKAVRGLVGRDADLIKIMVTGGATDPHTNRRATQYSQAELEVAIGDAHRLGRRVVGHANATTGIISAVAAGIDVVAHCNWLGTDPGTVVLNLSTISAMADRGTRVDLNLQGACRALADTDGLPAQWPFDLPAPRNRWELLAPLRAAGVEVYLTSDAFGPAIGSFPADLAAAAAEWGLGVEQLVHTVTELPARAFGIEDRGAVLPGRIADLAVFEADLRTDPAGLGEPLAVFQRGARTMHEGRLSPPTVARDHRDEALAQLRLIDEVFDELD